MENLHSDGDSKVLSMIQKQDDQIPSHPPKHPQISSQILRRADLTRQLHRLQILAADQPNKRSHFTSNGTRCGSFLSVGSSMCETGGRVSLEALSLTSR